MVESLGDVVLRIQIIRSHLRNVHINQVGVVSIEINHLVFVIPIDIDWMLNVEVLVRQDDIRVAIFISRSVHVEKLQIPVPLLFVDLEEEVFLGDHLIVGLCC